MEVLMIKDILKSTESQYKPAPFWSWNEKLRPEETVRQIEEMNKVGNFLFGVRFFYVKPTRVVGNLTERTV